MAWRPMAWRSRLPENVVCPPWQSPMACPERLLAVSQGMDLFRHADRYRTRISADGSFNGEFHVLTVGRTVLGNLIGDDLALQLIERLGLLVPPGVTVSRVPLYVSNQLVNAITPAMTGLPRKLFAQAKAIEYLAALVEYTCGHTELPDQQDGKARIRAQAVHDQILASEGKLLTLDELAVTHGRSAKLLNQEFADVFGQSIYAFTVNHRLQQAHDDLRKGETSIKAISASLGYSHVSNFTIAFKRKFGYSPGSLRRKQQVA